MNFARRFTRWRAQSFPLADRPAAPVPLFDIQRTSSIAAAKSFRHSSLVSPWPFAPGTSRQDAEWPPSSGSPACNTAVSVLMPTFLPEGTYARNYRMGRVSPASNSRRASSANAPNWSGEDANACVHRRSDSNSASRSEATASCSGSGNRAASLKARSRSCVMQEMYSNREGPGKRSEVRRPSPRYSSPSAGAPPRCLIISSSVATSVHGRRLRWYLRQTMSRASTGLRAPGCRSRSTRTRL